MKSLPPCVTCKFWSPDGQHTTSGWCHHHQLLADSSDWCGEHITPMTTSINPITDAVKAALFYAKPDDLTIEELDFACDQIAKHVTDYDRERVCPRLAAAARILANEVERLREELNTNKTVIERGLNTVISDCCEAPAVVAGKPNSTQWYVCPQCCQPCDVFYQDKNTQPL